MTDKKKKAGKSKSKKKSSSVKKVASKTSREIRIIYTEQPDGSTEGTIGPRPILPPVREGKINKDISPSPPIKIDK